MRLLALQIHVFLLERCHFDPLFGQHRFHDGDVLHRFAAEFAQWQEGDLVLDGLYEVVAVDAQDVVTNFQRVRTCKSEKAYPAILPCDRTLCFQSIEIVEGQWRLLVFHHEAHRDELRQVNAVEWHKEKLGRSVPLLLLAFADEPNTAYKRK